MVEKPFGKDSASSAELSQHLNGLFLRGDLPHRPLPRQGNGAEPAGTEVSGETNEGWVGVRVSTFSIPALLCSEQ